MGEPSSGGLNPCPCKRARHSSQPQLQNVNPEACNEEEHESTTTTVLDLPDEILINILCHVDTRSLMNCRQVCQTWNTAIVNSGKLIGRFTFKVTDLQTFLEWDLATKAKSLSFTNVPKGSNQSLDTFVNLIKDNVVRLGFKFGEFVDESDWVSTSENQIKNRSAKFFWAVFSNCTRLEELSVLSYDLNELTQIQDVPALATIRKFSVDVRSTMTFIDLRAFILSLSNLRVVRIRGPSYMFSLATFDTLCLHMGRYPERLKQIDFEHLTWLCFFGSAWKFPVVAGNNGVSLRIHGSVPLNELFEQQFVDGGLLGLPLTENNCQWITDAKLGIYHTRFEHAQSVGFMRNLTSLEINCERFLEPAEVQFLSKLTKLRRLKFGRDNWDFPIAALEDVEAIGQELGVEVFSPGLPNLENLSINVHIFALSVFDSFHSVFPCLSVLELTYLGNLPPNLFHSLAKLEKLQSLLLQGTTMFDGMLTELCQMDWNTTSKPAVAAFKCLKKLQIIYCNQLTDVCLTEGIAFSDTLEEVIFKWTRGPHFTTEGVEAFLQKGRFSSDFISDLENRFYLRFIVNND